MKKEKVEQIKKALKDGKCPVLIMAFKEMFLINVLVTEWDQCAYHGVKKGT